MIFDELLAQTAQLLQREQRVSYRGLKRRFSLDDDLLEDLKEELIGAKRVARDEDGRFLIWVGDAASPQVDPPSATRSATASAPVGTADAERRQLTVMFCDLVGSTALSEQLDPEELRETVRAYQAICGESICRYDGYVTQHLGDGLLAYFGFPTAHEDDSQRAVRAALEIAANVGARCSAALPGGSVPLQVRIGIHTGLVVIGEIGGSQKREILALGETPNLAARLQSSAKPDSVVISAATERLVSGLFDCRALGALRLKGLSATVGAFRVVRARDGAATPRGRTPLVGRTAELEQLRAAWVRAQRGIGEFVFLSGEAGIGKSRLVQELRDEVGNEDALRIELRCSAYHQSSALHPIIEHLQRILKFRRDESSQSRFAKLQQMLRHYRFPRAETLPLLADLLSLPLPDGTAMPALQPQKQKRDTMEMSVDWMLEDADRLPVLLICEDLQWADASTLELVQLLLNRSLTSRLLIVLTFRPEFRPPWDLPSPATALALTRLDRDGSVALIAKMTGERALPGEVTAQIVTKTDGVPLFVEELTKMVLESGLCREVDGRYELTRALPEFAIPATIQDSLTARLDRLAPVREIAQFAAVLGREFSYELIKAIAPFDGNALDDGLKQLVDAELVSQRGVPPHADYRFRHALVRDTAYQSLLKNKRRQLHETAARALEKQFREIAEAQPEIVARHYTEAGVAAAAVSYWLKAGQRAAHRSAYVEAMSHLTNGLGLLDAWPDADDRLAQELALRSVLGPVLIATKGWSAAETHASYARTRDLSAQLGQTPQLFRALSGIVSANVLEGRLQEARELGHQLLILADQMGDPSLTMEAHNSLGITMLYLGAPTLAREHLERAVAIGDTDRSAAKSAAALTAQNPGVAARAHLAVPLWMLGYPDQALRSSRKALVLARELAQPFSVAYALLSNALLHSFRREAQAALEMASELIAVCRDRGFSQLWLGSGMSVFGWSLLQLGRAADGVAQLRAGIEAIRAAGTELVVPYYSGLLADAYASLGQVDAGLQAVQDGLGVVAKTGERLWEAELHRLKGELTQRAAGGVGTTDAEACFMDALAIAREQRAAAIELRAATSLARVWRTRDRPRDAQRLLTDALARFDEGLATGDIKDARELLRND